jgi:hypothetical protein
MTKRAGRGHDQGGIEATVKGGLAVRCRACPQPGINLPQGWETLSEKDRSVADNAYDLRVITDLVTPLAQVG